MQGSSTAQCVRAATVVLYGVYHGRFSRNQHLHSTFLVPVYMLGFQAKMSDVYVSFELCLQIEDG